MPRLYFNFDRSLEDLCQKLETDLGRNFLVDITPEKETIDVGKSETGDGWYSPDYKNIKFIVVRLRGMFRNTELARIALVGGQVVYDDHGPVYTEQKTVILAVKKICN